jgi:type I restriction enzyme S subunit
MFGDIKDTIRLGDCCRVNARIGWQSLTTKEHMKTGIYMLITGTDFKNNEVDYSKCVYVSKERYEMDEHIILNNDDILITKDGTIGKVAIVHNLPKPATLNGGVFVVRPDDRFNKEYIAYVFKGPLFEEFVNKSKTGATIKHLNQKHLVEFNIPIPEKDEQVKFSNFYKQVDKQKFIKVLNSLKYTENMLKYKC